MSIGVSKRSGQKILIVDDDPLQRAAASLVLENAGFFVREVENGFIALREIEASQFDLVILDVLMPEMDGFETCRRLRENPETKDIPVLMVTGLEDVHSVEKAFEVGATNFMTKPLHWQLLNHQVRYILRSAAQQTARQQAEQKVRALNETLERRVEERTAALADLNRQLENEISKRAQADAVSRDTQAYLSGIMDNMADVVITFDEAGTIESANPACEAYFGWAAEELVGNTVALLMPELDRTDFDGYLKACQGSGGQKKIGNGRREVTAKRMDQSLFPMSLVISEMSLGGRRCFIGVGRDITVRKRYEAEILARAYQQSAIVELSRQALHLDDLNILYTNACALVAQTLEMGMAGIFEPIPHSETLELRASVGMDLEADGQAKVPLAEDNPAGLAFRTGAPVVIGDWVCEKRFSNARYISALNVVSSGFAPIVGQSRTYGVLEVHSRKFQDVSKGNIAFLEAITNVLSAAIERRQAELEAEKHLGLLKATFQNMSQGVAVFDKDFKLRHFNEHFARLFNFPPDFLRIGRSWNEIARYRFDHGQYGDGDGGGDDSATFEEHFKRSRDHGDRTGERALPDGTVYVYHRQSMPGGGFVTTYTDITERKAAEKAHEELAEQLYQAQKMEAVGQLAGGVAHDFNNILMVIDGYTRIARKDPDLPENVQTPLDQVLTAAEQAARLTKQLLVFGRRQVLETKVIKADSILPEMEILLRPLLGETINFRIAEVEEEIFIATDVAQLAQSVVNLAINARDAMPRGGDVSISMASTEADEELLSRNPELSSGTYLRIDVVDEGEGMDEETLALIFDPFFTTKEQGEGTGLGLAMVYGFVRQSKGAIEVESTVGKGTKFSIYLPTTDDPVEVTVEMDDADLMADGETILLVEDDDTLRDLVRANLGAYGYTVLTACNGLDALEVEMDHDGPIDLLLSDVVMPVMGGFELAKALQETRPDTKVLFMSGYPARGEIKQDDLPEGVPIMPKPCPPTRLARAVRDLITEREIA
jgi:PAS domain S-box-containing protein